MAFDKGLENASEVAEVVEGVKGCKRHVKSTKRLLQREGLEAGIDRTYSGSYPLLKAARLKFMGTPMI